MTAVTPQGALKAAEHRAKKNQAQRKMLDRLFKKWVPGSEMTPEQHAALQVELKAEFYERRARRAA